MSVQAMAGDPNWHATRCDHICRLPKDHDGLHQYGYEHPSPRSGVLPETPSAASETIHIGPDEGATVPLSFFAELATAHHTTCVTAWNLIAEGKYVELVAFLAEAYAGGDCPEGDAYEAWQRALGGLAAGSEPSTDAQHPGLRDDDESPMTAEQVAWVRAQRR